MRQNRFIADKLPGLFLLPIVISCFLPSPALAGTYSYKVVQTFGWDSGAYKIMVRNPRNGNRFLVRYPYKLNVSNGQTVYIEFDSYDQYWLKINNPSNGSWSTIYNASFIK